MAIPFHCQQYALATGGSTQDFTISGETRTAVAAYFHCVAATTVDTETAHLSESWGATDGTNEFFGSIYSEDNLAAASNAWTAHNTGAVIVLLDNAGAIETQLSFNSFITGGVRLDLDDLPGAAYLVNVWLCFEGSYAVGTVTTGAVAGTPTNVTGLGFDPTFLVVHEFGSTPFDATSHANANVSTGYVADNATSGTLQAVHAFHDRDNVGNQQVAGITDNSVGSGVISHLGVSGLTSYDFITDGFSATPVTLSVAHEIGYLAGRVEGIDQWAGHLTSPVATGAHSFTEPGINAASAMIAVNGLRVETHVSGASANLTRVAMFTQEDQLSAGGTSEFGKATSDTSSYATATKIIDYAFEIGTPDLVGTFTASTLTGFDVNITTATALGQLARLWPALVWTNPPRSIAIDEVLGLFEDVDPLGLVAVNEVLGIFEDINPLRSFAFDEVLGLYEEVSPLSLAAVDEVLGIYEEVDSYMFFAPSPGGGSVGEGGFARTTEGEGGQAGVVTGSG